jgi:signal transduction histidine kinase
MRSIRRSLIVSFTVLFVAALAGVALTLDRLAGQALEARERAVAESIKNQYEERCHEEQEKFKEQLLADARSLVTQMQFQYHRQLDLETRKFTTAYIIGNWLPTDPYTRMAWEFGNSYRGQFYWPAYRAHFAGLQLDNAVLSQVEQPGLYQINIVSRTESIWRSPSLEGTTLPTNRSVFDPDSLHDWHFDELNLDGIQYLRVVFRSPIFLPNFVRVPFGPRPAGGRSTAGGSGRTDSDRGQSTAADQTPPVPATGTSVGPPGASGPPTTAQFLDAIPKLYAHCARPLSALDPLLIKHQSERDGQLEYLSDVIRTERFRMRATVLTIGAVAIALILVGGLWLVRRGLTPLNKLSDAVARVSEKDFRLPADPKDLTSELVPIHARLTETLNELRRAFEREKQAVADISHELRTPVAALLTTLDVTLRKPRTAEQYKQALEECRTITRQLGQLVERVMTLAYLDAGHTQISRSRVAAAEVVANCASIIRPLAQARGLSFTLKADPSLELETDSDKLREVLMNLLHNAVEYSNPGGSVELVVRRNGGGRIAFDVRDTGIGMPDDVKEKIFERFYRADPSRTETGVHAGLGLAIVKEYVERLGGSISVESAPGKGSLFRVELPAASVEDELPKLAT